MSRETPTSRDVLFNLYNTNKILIQLRTLIERKRVINRHEMWVVQALWAYMYIESAHNFLSLELG